MNWPEAERLRRNNPEKDSTNPKRNPFQRDRDRILHSSALRRLGSVGQIASIDHIEPFHNRQIHTFKVAQIGRRLSEYILSQSKDGELDYPEELIRSSGLDPDVTEAACLAHDLGHPPFGHVGEQAIDRMIKDLGGDHEGYEGNAQTLRILSHLSLRSHDYQGLNLTQAVLAATIKYPWSYSTALAKGTSKFGYFTPEQGIFNFAREAFKGKDNKTLEAAIMDHADDVAYSVHDLEDFHRIRSIPWRVLLERPTSKERKQGSPIRMDEVIKSAEDSWSGEKSESFSKDMRRAAGHILRIVKRYPNIWREPYEGTALQRIDLRAWTSEMIARYTQKDRRPIVVEKDGYASLHLEENAKMEIHLLKKITQIYVTRGTVIGAQRYGHTRLVEEVFTDIYEDIQNVRSYGKQFKILPVRFHQAVRDAQSKRQETSNARLTSDAVSGLTEPELIALHSRLHGIRGGSVSDPIIR